MIIEADKQGASVKDKDVIRNYVSKRSHWPPEMYEIIEERKDVVAGMQHCEGPTQTAKLEQPRRSRFAWKNPTCCHLN